MYNPNNLFNSKPQFFLNFYDGLYACLSIGVSRGSICFSRVITELKERPR